MKNKLLLSVLFGVMLQAQGIDVGKDAICLIRKVQVYKEPKWIAKVVTLQDKSVYLSSPKSMFEYIQNAQKWPELGALNENDMKSIEVTDFNTLNAIDAKTAYYVYGSNQTSPGGDDLVPFATQSDAEAYMKSNNGKRILRFSEIKNSLIRLLNGRI
jgi:nitrous oxide reductase accessory protein NosL